MTAFVFVLGMHRSGTSALAGCLEIVGGAIPQHRVPAEAGNPKGHFEPAGVVEANEALLARIGRVWSDFAPCDVSTLEDIGEIVQKFTESLRSDYGDAEVAIVKDPRLSVTFPLWAEAARALGGQVGCVIPLRDAYSAAASLLRRDGIPIPHGVSLWIRSMLDSERHTRGLQRVFVDPHGLIGSPVEELDRIGDQLGIGWPRFPRACLGRLSEFLDRSLLHSAEPVGSDLANIADRLLTLLRNLMRGEAGPSLLGTLDQMQVNFDTFAPSLQYWMRQAEHFAVHGNTVDDKNLSTMRSSHLDRLTSLKIENHKLMNVYAEAVTERDKSLETIELIRQDRDHNQERAAEAIAERDKSLETIELIRRDRDHNQERAAEAIAERDRALTVIAQLRGLQGPADSLRRQGPPNEAN